MRPGRLPTVTSVPELVTAIDEYIAHHNTMPKPFIWTKSARDILQFETGRGETPAFERCAQGRLIEQPCSPQKTSQAHAGARKCS